MPIDDFCDEYGKLNPGIFSLAPVQYTLLSVFIGLLLIDRLDLSQQNSLGNFIVNVGQTILTAAAQGQLLNESNQAAQKREGPPKDISYDDMRRQIELLKNQIDIIGKKTNHHEPPSCT
ncbi:hypothetical protein SDC9_119234 [bioreactor metagenome]|uniref:Uncharacterized protein n=1 Tax=bioreactor metagenome TaxID=1076179 RepID=A0A645C5K3_9ZZZZ